MNKVMFEVMRYFGLNHSVVADALFHNDADY